MTDTVIWVKSISKCYQIYNSYRDRLKQHAILKLCQVPVLRDFFLISHTQPPAFHNEFWALKDVSFEIKKGETVGIIGRNGSGKSTLLQLICGTLYPTSGSVQTKGRIAALLELGSGFNREFTGRENVYMNAAVLGLSKDETDARYNDIVAFADIGDFIEQPVKTYSSGMSVRLAFAVIANVDADVLIIDEALAVGDVLFQQKCMRFLRKFKENGTVLFVSHNAGTVVNLCDRAIWLEKGEVQIIGKAKDVCEQYFTRRYQPNIFHKIEPNTINKPTNNLDHLALSNKKSRRYRDMRKAFINNSNLRNDIQIFEFSSVTKSFGSGGATIIYAGVEDLDGSQLTWVVGGEMIRIVVEALILIECKNVIIGFHLKDKLGQVLFAQNTYMNTFQSQVKASPGDKVEAIFTFQLPILPSGNYPVDVAIADGSPTEAVQLQWAHDVFILESQSGSVTGGLIGLSFDEIELRNKSVNTTNYS